VLFDGRVIDIQALAQENPAAVAGIVDALGGADAVLIGPEEKVTCKLPHHSHS
jgi:hypothetical protein